MGVRITLLKDVRLSLEVYGVVSIDREGHSHINKAVYPQRFGSVEQIEGRGSSVQEPELGFRNGREGEAALIVVKNRKGEELLREKVVGWISHDGFSCDYGYFGMGKELDLPCESPDPIVRLRGLRK